MLQDRARNRDVVARPAGTADRYRSVDGGSAGLSPGRRSHGGQPGVAVGSVDLKVDAYEAGFETNAERRTPNAAPTPNAVKVVGLNQPASW
ncbi:hypothetical protein LuPra_02170 [Luteitalea pratensis]|uniref:Uncharacterized protein n=1 Tax=Luteitalea pratensis TaxID=1855912 RepID=A0A143PMH0_LUTPR|nr:hypothetical protein LuPra_02170 [Luteitalea pratensis]